MDGWSNGEVEVSHLEEDSGIWLSIGDLMSGLLMFFALLFITVMVQLKQYQEAIDRLPVVVLNAIEKDLSGEEAIFKELYSDL